MAARPVVERVAIAVRGCTCRSIFGNRLYTGQRRRRDPRSDVETDRPCSAAARLHPAGPISITKIFGPIIPVPTAASLSALRRAHTRASLILYQLPRRSGLIARQGFSSAAVRAGIRRVHEPHLSTHVRPVWRPRRAPSGDCRIPGPGEAADTELYAHHHPYFMMAARASFE